jgi:hypothetical protein
MGHLGQMGHLGHAVQSFRVLSRDPEGTGTASCFCYTLTETGVPSETLVTPVTVDRAILAVGRVNISIGLLSYFIGVNIISFNKTQTNHGFNTFNFST